MMNQPRQTQSQGVTKIIFKEFPMPSFPFKQNLLMLLLKGLALLPQRERGQCLLAIQSQKRLAD